MRTAKKPKQRIVLPRATKAQLQAGEPNFDSIPSIGQLIRAYNWYNYSYTNEEASKFIYDYLTSIGKTELADKFEKPDIFLTSTFGWIARMLSNNLPLPVDVIVKFNNYIETYVNRATVDIRTQNNVSRKETAQRSIDNVLMLLTSGGESLSNVTTVLKECTIKATKEIAEQFQTRYETGNEKIKAYLQPLYQPKSSGESATSIQIASEEAIKAVVKKARKPRSKKIKTTKDLLKKIQFQEKCQVGELELISIEPEKMIGKTTLFVYNSKYRNIQVYYAMDDDGFSFKGTTLQRIDEQKSFSKKLRWAEKQLTEIIGKPRMKSLKVIDDIKCMKQKAPGRIWRDTVILAAY